SELHRRGRTEIAHLAQDSPRCEGLIVAREDGSPNLLVFGSSLELGDERPAYLQVQGVARLGAIDAQKQNTLRRVLGKDHGHGVTMKKTIHTRNGPAATRGRIQWRK